MTPDHDTIVAPATAAGGALAVIRISGEGTFAVCDRLFRGRRPLSSAEGYTAHYGRIMDGERTVDDVLATVFRAPHSYTGEHSVEISCHGSSYITAEILRLLTASGARMATPGEFTIRAYLAGKLDLSQAEAVADMIASSSRATHTLASTQMRGGYSAALDTLRDKLLDLTSLLELELDFSEEDVEFADRAHLRTTMQEIEREIDSLRRSFALGNAIKEGVAVAIVGAPNVGKSTLLNRLLNEDRAMVSEIAGTTRDVIEEVANIDGVAFRFLDTAGIRSTDDRLEQMGIQRTMSSIERARIIIHMVDASAPGNTVANAGHPPHPNQTIFFANDAAEYTLRPDQRLLTVYNKIDKAPADFILPRNALEIPGSCGGTNVPSTTLCISAPNSSGDTRSTDASSITLGISARTGDGTDAPNTTLCVSAPNSGDDTRSTDASSITLGISARTGDGTDALRSALRSAIDTEALYHGDAVVSSSRHYEALTAASAALTRALSALGNNLPADLLSEEIRQVILHLGTITGRGAIASDEVLQNIFSKFCIGK